MLFTTQLDRSLTPRPVRTTNSANSSRCANRANSSHCANRANSSHCANRANNEQSEQRTVRTTNSANSSHCANSAINEQCEWFILSEKCKHRTVRTVHVDRTVRTANSANTSHCANRANSSHCANRVNNEQCERRTMVEPVPPNDNWFLKKQLYREIFIWTTWYYRLHKRSQNHLMFRSHNLWFRQTRPNSPQFIKRKIVISSNVLPHYNTFGREKVSKCRYYIKL